MVSRAGDFAILCLAAGIFVAQQVAISFLDTDGAAGVVRQVLFFSATLLLAAFALHFRRYWGAWLVALGILMNLLPMAAHNGSMPIDYAIITESGAFPEVSPDDIGEQTNHGKDVVLEREDIHFYFLSDRFVVTLPLYGTNIYSLGDFVLFAGLAAVVIQAVAEGVHALTRRSSRPPATSPQG